MKPEQLQKIYEEVKDFEFKDIKDYQYVLSLLSPKTALKNDFSRLKWIVVYFQADELKDYDTKDLANYLWEYYKIQSDKDILDELFDIFFFEEVNGELIKSMIERLHNFGYKKDFQYDE
jgi:hypothetical protein